MYRYVYRYQSGTNIQLMKNITFAPCAVSLFDSIVSINWKIVVVVVFVFNVPPTAKVVWRRGHGLKSHRTDW